MSLTSQQRATGRAWRALQEVNLHNLNQVLPPDMVLPPFVRHVRHLCAAANGKSVSFDFAEVYVRCLDVPIAYVYHEGQCSGCRLTARSEYGFIVETADRPPSGRIVRDG
jgi:hypothetical protein